MNIPNPYTLPSIDFVGGSTQDIAFHCYFYANKNPFDLYSCAANFSLISYVNKRGEPLVSKEMEIRHDTDRDGEIANVLYVTLAPEDTVNLVGKYIYQITIRDVSGEIEIPNQGIIHIVNNINKSYV